jgi:para-nitrobenzyl esterase
MRRALIGLGVIAVLAAAFLVPWGRARAEAVRVQVHDGVLVGTSENGVAIFKGIPYAAPPVGALRWVLPQPVIAWKTERAATAFGASCMQPEPPRNVPPDSPAAQMSEDCLYLNVWAPGQTRRAPVMVWLHGGGNRDGSSADRYADGAAFARDGVVLISLNYRLGVFGFLPQGGEANFGLWDQLAALRWVRQNAAAFGGDPDNVTLFGESSGAEDILALMCAPQARGLFKHAIAESPGGGWAPPKALTDAPKDTSLMALRSIPAAKLLQSAEALDDWGITVDGHLLSEAPMSAFAAGHAAAIPLIIGTNDEEGSLLGPDAKSEGMLTQLDAADLARLKALYGPQSGGDAALARLLFRDAYFAGPARSVATAAARAGAPVYFYRFAYVMSVLQGRRAGAHHGSEIPYVFENWPTSHINEADQRIGRALHDCWIAFARSGKPDCADAPEWRPLGDGRWMFIDAHPGMRAIEDAAALDLLQSRLAADTAH